MDRSSWKNDLLLLAVILVWGLNFPVVKGVLEIMPPHVLNAFRFVVSVSVLGALYAFQRRRELSSFFAPLRELLWPIVGLGMLGFVFYQACFIIGLSLTTAGNAALIMASAPLWTAVTGYFLRLERLDASSWLALVVVFAGAAVIVIGGGKAVTFDSETFLGNVIMLGASLCWGIYTALSRPVLRRISATGLSFLSLLFALPILFTLAIPNFGQVDWGQVTPWTWVAIIYSGGLSTGLAVAIWNRAVHQAGASQTAVYGNLVPVAALISSALLLGERITVVQVVGGVLILGGLLYMRRTRRTPAPTT